MKRRISIFLILGLILSILSACQSKPKYKKYDYNFFGTFDTIIQIVGYTESEEEFNSYAKKMEERFGELHKLYDRYNSYEGINNIKTINENAGIKPVEVEKEIIDLITFSKEWYEIAGPETNIAMGPVVDIWSKYRDEASADPSKARLAPIEDLEAASKFADMNKVIVDTEKSTIYLEEEGMSLDVGSVAKGYATELVAKEIEEEGFISAIISAGGNIRTIGKPMDGLRERWGIGIQDPDAGIVPTESNILDTVFVNNGSVVTSGDYERYYLVGDIVVHHIIDPNTLMPGDIFRAVAIVTPDSGLADFLSTSMFLLPYEEGLQLAESLDDVEVLWVMKDGTIEATPGMKEIMRSQGATGAKAK